MSGPKRNPDKLNTIGIVVVGVCSAVLVYVAIVALQAFYVNDTSEIQTMADYGGQDTQAKNIRATQTLSLTAPPQPNPKIGNGPQTYRVPLKYAMDRMLESLGTGPQCGDNDSCAEPMQCRVKPGADPRDPKAHVCVDLGHLVPMARSDKATVKPAFGRPVPLQPPPAADGAGSGSAATPPPGAGSAETGAGPGSGSAGPTMTPTGGQGPGGGNAPHQAPNTTKPTNAGSGSITTPAKGNGR
jgi:hypothetical protein